MKLKKVFAVMLFAILLYTGSALTASAALVDDLTKALNDAGITDTGLIVEHLQKINISESEENKIKANIDTVQEKLTGITDISSLSAATKTEIANLMTESAKLLQMDIQFIDNSGNPVNLASYATGGLKIKITDANGSTLAIADPKKGDLNADKLTAVTTALKVAAEKAQEYSTTFQAESGGRLPDTGTHYGNTIILGLALALLGVLTLIPVLKFVK